MSARDKILNRARAALGPGCAPELPAAIGLERGTASIERFREKLEGVGGVLHRVADTSAAEAVLAEIVATRDISSLALSDAPELQPLTSNLGSTVTILQSPADRAALLTADAGLTTVQGAIAETGTLVLDSTAELHRLVSLLPPLHIALLRAEQLLPDLGTTLAHFGSPSPPPTLTFITGPSRTADIELELVIGVHGPKELVVILVGGD
jgi:L-lactate dehydrogenase complex protein LldG